MFSKEIRQVPISSLHQLSFPRDQYGTSEAQDGHKGKASLQVVRLLLFI